MGLRWNGTGPRVVAARVRETFKLLLSPQAVAHLLPTPCRPSQPHAYSSTQIRQRLGLGKGFLSSSGHRFSQGAEPFPLSDRLRDLPSSHTAVRPDAVLVCLLPSASTVGFHFLPGCAVQLRSSKVPSCSSRKTGNSSRVCVSRGGER